jgi:hypothetical protein
MSWTFRIGFRGPGHNIKPKLRHSSKGKKLENIRTVTKTSDDSPYDQVGQAKSRAL